jgi:hypothetical protein
LPFDDQRKLAARVFRSEIFKRAADLSTPVFFVHLRHLAGDADAAVTEDGEDVFERVNDAVRGF